MSTDAGNIGAPINRRVELPKIASAVMQPTPHTVTRTQRSTNEPRQAKADKEKLIEHNHHYSDKVSELSSLVLDVWREVKMLTANGESVAEPFMEQIDLEVLALTLDADDPERLEKTAASAVAAAGNLLSFHAPGAPGQPPSRRRVTSPYRATQQNQPLNSTR